jgi:hypothetical protein
MKKKKKIKFTFQKGDWIGTKQIEPAPGNSYTMAQIKKVLGGGLRLLVEYGGYKTETIVESKTCVLIKRI